MLLLLTLLWQAFVPAPGLFLLLEVFLPALGHCHHYRPVCVRFNHKQMFMFSSWFVFSCSSYLLSDKRTRRAKVNNTFVRPTQQQQPLHCKSPPCLIFLFLISFFQDSSNQCYLPQKNNRFGRKPLLFGRMNLQDHREEEEEEVVEENDDEEDDEDVFAVLPNELVSYILLVHLHSMWHLVCKHVCHRWRNLLLAQRTQHHSLPKVSYAAVLASGGHLEVLQWAIEQGCPWDQTQMCAYAALGGHLEVLQWARSQGCPWDERTCGWAARGGHLEVLQWARSQGCPWNEEICATAARGGHLEVLQWARSQGCPWDQTRVCGWAAGGGHLEVLQWAIEQGCPEEEEEEEEEEMNSDWQNLLLLLLLLLWFEIIKGTDILSPTILLWPQQAWFILCLFDTCSCC